jgi:hypothetical protein
MDSFSILAAITNRKITVMAFSTTVVQPATQPVSEKPASSDALSSLLAALIVSAYAAQKSKKAMRKMRRHLVWSALKLKMKSLFSKRAVSNQTLIYILIGVVALILVFWAPILALVIALIALILILAGVI